MKRLGDPIFHGMNLNIEESSEQGTATNFVFFGGDQIYADALGESSILMPANEFDEYAALYEKAFSQEHFRKLATTRGLPIYMVRDDHELWNDANAEEEAKRPQQSADGHKAYTLYQKPFGKDTPNYWYTVSNGAEMFITDTRSERLPSQQKIISNNQMQALKDWIIADSRKDRIKIIATSVPMFLLDSDDSWNGFMEQKHELLNLIHSF
jgi:phosphodiesterase/alkaline phosphatase D-like protein